MGPALHQVLHRVLVVLVAVAVLASAAAIGLAWRLAQGPLDIAWAARRIEAAANTPDGPTRLSIGTASVQWAGFADGATRGLSLLLRNVHLVDLRAAPVAQVNQVDLTVSVPRLLLGQVVPRAVLVDGLLLSVQRNTAGAVAIDLGGLDLTDSAEQTPGEPGPSVQETLEELARPVRRPGVRRSRPDLTHLEELQTVSMRGSVFLLHDPALAGTIRVDVMALDLVRRPGGGVHGTAAAAVSLDAVRTTVALHAELAPDGGTQVQMAFAPVNAATVQDAAPAMATADTVDAAIGGAATLNLDAALRPTAASLRLEAGAGRLRLAGALIGFDSLALQADAGWDRPGWHRPDRLGLQRLRAVVHAPGGAWPTTLTAAGAVRFADGRAHGEAEGTLDHVDFADLGALWPARLGGHVRPWLVPNVTAGTARDASVKLSFEAPADFSDGALTAIDASLRGENVTIWWLRPVPPVEQVQALLTMKTPAVLDIAVSSGRQGAMTLRNGLIHFTGMDVKDQDMALTADIAGPVPDVLALLKHPRLALLDRKPIPMKNPAGAMAGKLRIDMPMKDHLEFEEVRIQTTSRLTDLRLGGLVAGRDLERGDITLDVTTDELRAQGRATVAGIPSELTVGMDFRNGGPSQVVQRAQLTGRATGRQLSAANIGPGSLMPAGTGQFVARYQQRRDGGGDVQVTADLRDAQLALAGWRKEAGAPASAQVRLLLKGDRMTGIDQLHAQGPGMAVDGHVEMVGDEPLLLVLDRLTLGPTQARGQVRFPERPEDPIRATLSGPVLDLSTELRKPPEPAAAPAASKADAPWVADVRFDRVLMSAGRGFTGVVAHAENDGRRLAVLTATTAGPEKIQVSLRPEGTGRRLTLRAADGGALLRDADLVDTVRGGALAVDAVYDDRTPAAPLSGTARLTDFTVLNAPILGKLLQAATIYGLVDALRGPGLVFSDLVLPFRWEGGVLQIADARAFSASLGLTAKGRLDTGRQTLDIEGTVVPAYVLNSLLGRIPLVGRLFSAERGGGLVAVGYGLHGPMADPSIRVNPLSALTPGFLRGLFNIFD